MARRLKWTSRAEKNFENILQYLDEEFGKNVSQSFVIQTFAIILSIQSYPKMGSVEDTEKDIRAILITKHNLLFYRYDSKNIILLYFFDTRSKPKIK